MQQYNNNNNNNNNNTTATTGTEEGIVIAVALKVSMVLSLGHGGECFADLFATFGMSTCTTTTTTTTATATVAVATAEEMEAIHNNNNSNNNNNNSMHLTGGSEAMSVSCTMAPSTTAESHSLTQVN